MELTKEIIEAHKLGEDTVKAIQEYGAGIVANEKNAISEALKGEANANAEKILSGAAAKFEEMTKIKRNDGEKIADYVVRGSAEFLSGKSSELDQLKAEYLDKVKKAGAGDLDKIKAEYQQEKDDLLKKYADFDTFKEKAEKADNYEQELSGLKLQVAFGNVKPSFPDTANPYEVQAKWAEFVKGVQEKYIIELDGDNQAVYIAKENKFKTGKLADLVKADEAIQGLAAGRKQDGLGGKPKEGETEEIEGVPFKVTKGATNAEISKQVKEYLTSAEGKSLSVTSKEYSEQFSKLYSLIKQKTAAK